MPCMWQKKLDEEEKVICGRPLIRTAYQAYITLLIFIKKYVIIYM